MRYDIIKKYDTSNGVGIRVSVFFTGCRFHCPGCFNKEIWEFTSGKPFDDDAKGKLINALSDPHITGLSILGGEPLQQNLDELSSFIKEVREQCPDKDIWMWTGYYLDELDDEQRQVVALVDHIVDGRFDLSEKGDHISYRGSSNQTIWDVFSDGSGTINFIKSNLN